jgi:hypothetical protein
MTTHYLVDLYNNTLNNVVTAGGTPPTTSCTGNYVVRVPDEVAVRNPTDLADLITKKYQGLLGAHALYNAIIFDDFLDETGIDFLVSTGIITGSNGSIAIYPRVTGSPTPVLQSTTQGLSSIPTQFLLTYELFEYVDVDGAAVPFQRSYQEVVTDVDVSVEVSFDGGASFTSTMDQSFTNIPVPSQGNQLVVRFTRTTSISTRGRIFLGSWAVLF